MTTTTTTTIPAKKLGPQHDVSAFTSKEASQFILQNVHVTESYIEAADGKILIQVDATENIQGEQKLTVPALVGRTELKEAAKRAAIVSDENGDGSKKFRSQNWEIRQEKIEGNFPNTERLWSDDTPQLTICFNARLLKKICDYAIKHARRPKPITFHFFGSEKAAKFEIRMSDGSAARGLIMPMC